MKSRKDRFLSGKKVFSSGKTFILVFFLIISLGFVAGEACCLVRNDGAVCEVTDQGNCASGPTYAPTCESIAACDLGCCIDPQSGDCAKRTTKGECQAAGGEWRQGENCDIQQCTNVCCTIGGIPNFLNPTQCNVKADQTGLPLDFLPGITTQLTCEEQKDQQAIGACTYQGDTSTTCRQLTQEACDAEGGDFLPNALCSNDNTGTSITKQAYTDCVAGLDEVYWFDSNGNRENIWEGNSEAQRESSWNNGFLKEKQDSCGYGQNNAGTTCGNCDTLQGSTCNKDSSGKAQCVNLGCEAAPTMNGPEDKNHGDKWCMYESTVGDGKDVPGSSHYVYTCRNGEVTIDKNCDGGQEYGARDSVCVASTITTAGGDVETATCREVDQSVCIGYNGLVDPEAEGQERADQLNAMSATCEANPDCYIQKYDFSGGKTGERGAYCLPQFPLGLSTNPDYADKAASYCGLINYECTMIKRRPYPGAGYRCRYGCDCPTQKFVEEMNNMCTSLGDCGASANIAGVVTNEGYSVQNTRRISSQSYLEELRLYSIPTAGFQLAIQATIVDNEKIEDFVGLMNGETYFLDEVIALVLFKDNPIRAQQYLHDGVNITEFGFDDLGELATIEAGQINTWETAAGFHLDFPGLFLSDKIGGTVGGWLDKIGWSGTKTYQYRYTCQPWEAPYGGDDCSKCDDDPLKTCTKYKCESLGKLCEYIPENALLEGEDTCIGKVDDGKAPFISARIEGLDEGYQYLNEETYKVTLRDQNGQCIPGFTPFNISIKTDEHAKCYLVKENNPGPVNWDDIEKTEGFLGTVSGNNGYVLNHTKTELRIPSPEAEIDYILEQLEDQGETGNINSIKQQVDQRYNDYNYYIRCIDLAGLTDPQSYVINTCVQSLPDIQIRSAKHFEPTSGGYISINQLNETVQFYLDEPAECRYSRTEDTEFDDMENELFCSQGLDEQTVKGWACNVVFKDLQPGPNDFYIKCRDQPWLTGTEQEEKRNTHTNDQHFRVERLQTQIEITGILPNENQITGERNAPVEITVQTQGGGSQHQCSYSFLGFTNLIPMSETGSPGTHKQTGLNVPSGKVTLSIQCKDETGDTTQATSEFRIIRDTNPPAIARVWQESGVLYLITPEVSECRYSLDNCNFKWEEGENMDTGNLHTTDTRPGKTYHIKCEDEFGNAPNSCSIRVNIPG